MSESKDQSPVSGITRRDALKGTGLAAMGVAAAAALSTSVASAGVRHEFYGTHQGGVATPIQEFLAYGTFDVVGTRAELETVLQTWTAASAHMVEGRSLPGAADPTYPPSDTGEAAGLKPASLTITIGFGPSMFDRRFGLSQRRPAALVELPSFFGDRLDPQRTGGDLCVQACADDPVVAFHAVRNLARIASGVAVLRDLQLGSGRTSSASGATPRNLLGFKDGTNNVRTSSTSEMNKHVWVGSGSDQAWMTGGTYLVARRIRVRLEQWSSLALATQQETIGRFRESGAPLTGSREHDPLELGATNAFGQHVIADSAHVRVASHQANDGVRILRRGFNFTDGLDPRTGELDAGLMFICFQRDPRRQFVTLQNRLAANDALSRYVVHTGSGLFAIAPGSTRGHWIGEGIFA
jgi:deferrochelatase/peroxidase EfeB